MIFVRMINFEQATRLDTAMNVHGFAADTVSLLISKTRWVIRSRHTQMVTMDSEPCHYSFFFAAAHSLTMFVHAGNNAQLYVRTVALTLCPRRVYAVR